MKPAGFEAPPAARMTLRRTAAVLWDRIFGPPRVHDRPDGGVTVRLMGRRFEAATRAGLFDVVAREREQLLAQVAEAHARSGMRPFPVGRGLSDTYHQTTRRLEDRIGIYSAFLGRLAQELESGRAD